MWLILCDSHVRMAHGLLRCNSLSMQGITLATFNIFKWVIYLFASVCSSISHKLAFTYPGSLTWVPCFFSASKLNALCFSPSVCFTYQESVYKMQPMDPSHHPSLEILCQDAPVSLVG